MRTYSGHSSAKASNELYRTNLAKGQTGLSVAFDLPTQTGYDADHPLARGEVGKVGVPISCLDDMDVLFDGLPLDEMNTSMTINATAAWLLALYVALAERRAPTSRSCRARPRTTSSRSTCRAAPIFPPRPLTEADRRSPGGLGGEDPQVEPDQYLQLPPAGGGGDADAGAGLRAVHARAVLDAVKESGQVPPRSLPTWSAASPSSSMPASASSRSCKMRGFTGMWDSIAKERYGVDDPKMRRFRYGVQVNSLGLTEQQPENNVQRIVLEMLGVVLSKSARARAIQLPAWNEALGLPRPWDQQWSLRIQQVLAFETDLLEYGDLFDGSPVVQAKMQQLIDGATAELNKLDELGGMVAAVESGYVKRELVRAHTERMRAIERGELKIIGVNSYGETAESPLAAKGEGNILKVDPAAERDQIKRLEAHRAKRNDDEVKAALAALEAAAQNGDNMMTPSIRCAHAGVTTGEWGMALRSAYGEYRPASGVDITTRAQGDAEAVGRLRGWVRSTSNALGRPLKILIGKPGLDGHSNGAEQIAVKARDVGMEVVYEGIRLTPEQIVVSAQEEGVHVVGLSVLSGSHLELGQALMEQVEAAGIGETPVVIGGIIPPEDAKVLETLGIARVYTPKDRDLNGIMGDIIDLVRRANGLGPLAQ
jgi:(2R)-ethylmalonyl-CoA mutase